MYSAVLSNSVWFIDPNLIQTSTIVHFSVYVHSILDSIQKVKFRYLLFIVYKVTT